MEAYESAPPVVLWSCGLGLVLRVLEGLKEGLQKIAGNSWFWEFIDMAYSQLGTIPWGGWGGARTHTWPDSKATGL